MDLKETERRVVLHVEGMTWMAWEHRVVRALVEFPGVHRISASYPLRQAVVLYDPERTTVDRIRDELRRAGYTATPEDGADAPTSADTPSEPEFLPRESDVVCHCFGYTAADIERDFRKNGRSVILESIAQAKKEHRCACAEKNPRGRWCLPDVRRVVDALR